MTAQKYYVTQSRPALTREIAEDHPQRAEAEIRRALQELAGDGTIKCRLHACLQLIESVSARIWERGER